MVAIGEGSVWVGHGLRSRHWTAPVEPDATTTVSRGTNLELTVEADPNTEAVSLHIQPLSGLQLAEPLPLVSIGGNRWRLRFQWTQLGSHRLQLRYRQQGQWLIDAQAPCFVLVIHPQQHNFRMYTMIPRVSGHMGQWVQQLDRIRDLGFNTIHILPINQQDVTRSPYAATDPFEVDAAWLDPLSKGSGLSQWKHFVDQVQRRDMRLCLDLVVNHVGLNHAMVRQHPLWLHSDLHEPDGLRRAGWLSPAGWKTWRDLVLINYDTQPSSTRAELWQYMTEYGLSWSSFAAQCGGIIRLDNLHSSHPGFMRHLLSKIRQTFPDLCFLGELFGEEDQIDRMTRDLGINLLLATTWEHKFVPELRRYLTYLHRRSAQCAYYCPVNSHDSHAIPQEFGSMASAVPRLALSALFGTGARGLSQGVEYAIQTQIEFIGDPQPLDRDMDANLVDWVRRLNQLLDQSPELTESANLEFVDSEHPAVLAGFRHGKHHRLLGVINMDIVEPQAIEIRSLTGLSARCLLTGHPMTDGAIQLNPGQVCVFRWPT